MIIDSLEAFDHYLSLNPLFAIVADYLRNTDLSTLPVGKTVIKGDDIFINVQDAPAKSKDEARFETHRRMIDIQIPISDCEEHGWAPASQLPRATYDETTDMTLHDPVAPSLPSDIASTYFKLVPGQFAIYFPTDGHAPAITDHTIRKAIIKVKVEGMA